MASGLDVVTGAVNIDDVLRDTHWKWRGRSLDDISARHRDPRRPGDRQQLAFVAPMEHFAFDET